jgi:hypothetical protein
VRIHLIAGLAVLLVAGTALGQESKKQRPVPGRASLPSAPMFRGGFARIGPGLPQPPKSTPTAAVPAGATSASLPQALGRGHDDHDTGASVTNTGSPDSNQAAASEHHHDHGGCTGQCDTDHDAPAAQAKPEQAPVSIKIENGEVHLVQNTEPRPATEPTAPRSAPRGSYCASCHPNGLPQAKASGGSRVSNPDTRIAAIRDLRLQGSAGDRHLLAGTGIIGTSGQARPPAPPETPGAAPAVEQPTLASVEDLSARLGAHPDDFHLMRELAVAQLAAKNPRQAAETMAKAYKADPLLSKEPLDAKALGLSKSALSGLANAASTNAKASKTPQAWLLAAVMLQAQDARPQALVAVDGARNAGLDADLCDWMATSLKAKPKQLADAK